MLVLISTAGHHHGHSRFRLAADRADAERPFVERDVGFGTGVGLTHLILVAEHIIVHVGGWFAIAIVVLGMGCVEEDAACG